VTVFHHTDLSAMILGVYTDTAQDVVGCNRNDYAPTLRRSFAR
jgi:hypothetical protein